MWLFFFASNWKSVVAYVCFFFAAVEYIYLLRATPFELSHFFLCFPYLFFLLSCLRLTQRCCLFWGQNRSTFFSIPLDFFKQWVGFRWNSLHKFQCWQNWIRKFKIDRFSYFLQEMGRLKKATYKYKYFNKPKKILYISENVC